MLQFSKWYWILSYMVFSVEFYSKSVKTLVLTTNVLWNDVIEPFHFIFKPVWRLTEYKITKSWRNFEWLLNCFFTLVVWRFLKKRFTPWFVVVSIATEIVSTDSPAGLSGKGLGPVNWQLSDRLRAMSICKWYTHPGQRPNENIIIMYCGRPNRVKS